MKPESCFIKGLRFVSRKTNLHLTLLIGIILTVSVTAYVLVSQGQSLYRVISTNKEQQNKDLIITDSEPFALKLTAQHASPTKQDVPHRTYLITRTRCTQRVFLLIVVFSAPANFDRRTIIRKTWGTDPSIEIRWKTMFLLGQVAGDRIRNDYLAAEGMMYGDFVRGAQNEHYFNLTLKTQMGLEWAAKYCDFNFLLKADDDVFVNPYNLMDYLGKPDTSKTNLYIGRCWYGSFVMRRGKNGVSWKEYNKTKYPPFCSGPAYVLSSDLVSKLWELFDVKRVFKNEDVYIGMLIENIGGIRPVFLPGFRGNAPCEHHSGTFSFHRRPMSVQCMEELFNEAMKEKVDYELTKL